MANCEKCKGVVCIDTKSGKRVIMNRGTKDGALEVPQNVSQCLIRTGDTDVLERAAGFLDPEWDDPEDLTAYLEPYQNG